MESAGARTRAQKAKFAVEKANSEEVDKLVHSDGYDYKPPTYIIDLSLLPFKRYQMVASDFKSQIHGLPILFDEVIQSLHPTLPLPMIRFLARLVLRRLYSREETEEIRGISQVTGVHMYLLVAFNTFLDLFMGCTSGGIRTKDRGGGRMLHFRTLDWGMDPLREVVVQLDYVRRPGEDPIATTITYAGFVGCLTGVRRDLSLSLNFRPNHKAGLRSNFRFYMHHLLVLLGIRPSISAILRQCLLPLATKNGSKPRFQKVSLASIEATLQHHASTAAYLTFSDGEKTVTMEKDHLTALVRSDSRFIVVTNHDMKEETIPQDQGRLEKSSPQTLKVIGMAELVKESTARKGCMARLYERKLERVRKNRIRQGLNSDVVLVDVKQEDLIAHMGKYPITNEETHFAVVMDPKAGKVVWIRRYLKPIEVN